MIDALIAVLAVTLYLKGCAVAFKAEKRLNKELRPGESWRLIDILACIIAVMASWGAVPSNGLYRPMLIRGRDILKNKDG